MLKIVSLPHRHLLEPYLKEFDPNQSTWIVSDLRSKLEVKELLFSKGFSFEENAVLRASDLWKFLLKKIDLKKRIVSDSFAKILIKQVLDNNSETLGINATSSKTLFGFLQILGPILFHPQGIESLEAWFAEKPDAAEKWRVWFLRARFCVQLLVEKEHILIKDWLAPYLLSKSAEAIQWQYRLFVDLGAEMTQAEAELFRNISRKIDVTVFSPNPSWKSDFNYLLQPYDFLESEASEKSQVSILPVTVATFSEPAQKKREIIRFASSLAEVKQAVYQIRNWLEEGIPLRAIAVAAPDIEKYWICLKTFLIEEGIPFQKDTVVKAQSLLDIKIWLAHLRSRSLSPNFMDLELSYFNTDWGTEFGTALEQNVSTGKVPSLRYEIFKSFFTNLYGSEDLQRDSEIEKSYLKKINFYSEISREDFILTCLKYWSGVNWDFAAQILEEILVNAQKTTHLSWNHWLSYLESIVSQKEFPLTKGTLEGITVTSISSLHSLDIKYRIFLGLSEDAFRKSTSTKIDSADTLSFSALYGFYLENPDQSYLEFELKWQSDSATQHDLFLFANCDFQGQLQTVSKFWLEELNREGKLNNYETLAEPGETRWDHLMAQTQLEKLQFPRTSLMNDGLHLKLRNLLDRDAESLPCFSHDSQIRISPSSLDRFFICPFLFAVDRKFNLLSLPESDLDVDPMSKGQIAHALFCFLTEEPFQAKRAKKEIEVFLENYYEKNHSPFVKDRLKQKFSPNYWNHLKTRFVETGLRFLQHETCLRQDFPQTKTIGRETYFKINYNPTFKSIEYELSPNSLIISGRIDRIDSDDSNHLVVIDYKSSLQTKHTLGRWISERNLQLLLYAWVIEKEWIPEIKGSVSGLFYLSVKNFQRKGFRDNDSIINLYPPVGQNKKANTAEAKHDLLNQFDQIFTEAALQIQAGDFKPLPMDKKSCPHCEYKKLCRAPHLI